MGACGVLVGVTGGVGCGKSSVLRLLARGGFRTLEADRVVRDLLGEPVVRDAVWRVWGRKVFCEADPSLAIDRECLRETVAGSREALMRLECLLHPLVRDFWQRQVRQARKDSWAVELPLLFEKKLEKNFELLLCVVASPSVCLARVRERGWSLAAYQAFSRRLFPLERKCLLADLVLEGGGSEEFLATQLRHLFL